VALLCAVAVLAAVAALVSWPARAGVQLPDSSARTASSVSASAGDRSGR